MRKLTPIAALLLVGALAAPAAADKQFNPGALILPTGSAYQSDCGAVAVYGLVYDVLRANAYLAAHPLIAPNGAISVYYSFNSAKTSPNRCSPTNKSSNPSPANDPKWIDGCDFTVYDNTKTPVRLVDNTDTSVTTTTESDVVTFDTTGSASGSNPKIYPGYAQETINFTTNTTNTVRYLGAPFIIDDSDADMFMKLVSGAVTVYDNADGTGNVIDFTPFRANPGTCDFGNDIGGYVRIHRAKTIFNAPAPKEFTAAPPRLALLATTSTVSAVDIKYPTVSIASKNQGGASESGTTVTIKTTSSHGLSTGQKIQITGMPVNGYNGTWTISSVPSSTTFRFTAGSGLSNSGGGTVIKPTGLYKSGNIIYGTTSSAHGLTAGQSVIIEGADVAGYNATWTLTTVPTSSTFTIDTGNATALAASYDGADIVSATATATHKVDDGILQKYLKNAGLEFTGAGGCPPGGANVGNVTKCPNGGVHGQIYDTFDFADINNNLLDANYKMIWTPHWELTSDETTNPSTGEVSTLGKISTFLDGQTGLMAECHSIESFEGAYEDGSADQRGATIGQFQTCVGSGTTCSAGTTAFGVNKNPGTKLSDNKYFPNCTDPGRSNGANCIYFGDPGDPFAQPGDFSWYTERGSVDNFINNSSQGVIYKPGVVPLISGVKSLDTTKTIPSAAARTAMVNADYVTRNSKDNDSAKANILYMGGHDVSGVVAGTKVILQTLLLLGEPPIVTVTTEVTRSTPIHAHTTEDVLVQGSFEKVTPPPTTLQANDDASVDNWRFPDLQGHMRAYQESAITTSATDLTGVTALWDAAAKLPSTDNSYTGCGSAAFGAGTGGCRTIWTHTQAGAVPARVILDQTAASNTTLLGLLNTNGGTLTTAKLGLFIQRLIKGRTDAGGTFVAQLGGVDRSTVAIVPSSVVSNANRPTIVYFGGTDGMLHAVCGDVKSGTGCDEAGREIWGFIPRLQLGNLRKNTARVDGSPRVMDLYGDFTSGNGTGAKSFRTILMFQTGSGDPATAGLNPSVTALDITDPFDPKVVWEFTAPGQGLIMAAGPVRTGGIFKNYAFVQTNHGATSGNILTAVDMETGDSKWTHTLVFPETSVGREGGNPPYTGIPGGAVGVDKNTTGAITDVVMGTLYGELWQLDAATGDSKEGGGNPGTALFRYKHDEHPIGASPTIYSAGGGLFAVAVPGGYADLSTSGSLWSADDQTAVAVSLDVPTSAPPPLDEDVSNTAYIPWKFNLDSGDKAFAQAIVVGGEIFITADSININDSGATGYGTQNADTGHVYQVNLTDGSAVNTVVVRGGAGSVETNGTTVYSFSKDKGAKLAQNATSLTGDSPGSAATPKVTRLLWLRTL